STDVRSDPNHVRFGSRADMCGATRDVSGNGGHDLEFALAQARGKLPIRRADGTISRSRTAVEGSQNKALKAEDLKQDCLSHESCGARWSECCEQQAAGHEIQAAQIRTSVGCRTQLVRLDPRRSNCGFLARAAASMANAFSC